MPGVTSLDYFFAYHAEVAMCDALSPLRYRGRKPSDDECKLCKAPAGECCRLVFRPSSSFERGHPVELEEPFSGPLYQSPEQLAEAESFRDDPYLAGLRAERNASP